MSEALHSTDGPREKVQVRLSTRDPAIAIPSDPGATLVSTTFRRLQLSTLVNNLLQNERPTPFEFLINGQFLRTTIDDFLTHNGISAETVLNVEYIRALVPPLHIASFEHDDWVSSAEVLSQSSAANNWSAKHTVAAGQERILSASYDGLLRVWNTSASLLATSSLQESGGRIASIKTAKFLSPTRIVSGGLDMAVRIWKYNETPEDGASTSLTPALELYGHKWGIESLAVHGPSSRILSASTDHTIGFWSTRASEAPPAPEKLTPRAPSKRQKLSNPSSNTSAPPRRGPLALLSAHSAPVSSVIFSPQDPTVAYSASHDHTIRTWDLPSSTPVSARTTSSALLSLTSLPALSLLATGSSARHITLIDPRESSTTISVLTLRGHTNAVVSLAVDPYSEYGLVSSSHDGTCKIWDVRSVRPGGNEVGGGQVGESVYTIERENVKGAGKKVVGGEGIKVFSVSWDRDVGIVSAGEDRRVQINQGAKGPAAIGGGG